jgi:hypothetical protein
VTIWEYGHLYLVVVTPHYREDGRPVFIAEDGAGARMLEGCRDFIRAANTLGADGWIIDGQGASIKTPSWLVGMVEQLELVVGATGVTVSYFMRRAGGS